MSFTPTKTTTVTWAQPWAEVANLTIGTDTFDSERTYKLAEMVTNNQTTLTEIEVVSDTVVRRNWSDQTAAEAWVDFLNALCTKYGTTITSSISDYAPH